MEATKLWHVRWIIDVGGRSLPAQTELLRSQVIPRCRRHVHHEYYVSRQENADRDLTVWITAFVPEEDRPRLVGGVTFDNHLYRVELDTRDRLLLADAETYRPRLHRATLLAFDLLAAREYLAHREFLVRASLSGTATPECLAAYLDEHSPTHRNWPAELKQAFWARVSESGPDGLSPPGHWIWNLVVGPEPHHGEDPVQFLRRLDAGWAARQGRSPAYRVLD